MPGPHQLESLLPRAGWAASRLWNTAGTRHGDLDSLLDSSWSLKSHPVLKAGLAVPKSPVGEESVLPRKFRSAVRFLPVGLLRGQGA